jgi:hypothetical protein
MLGRVGLRFAPLETPRLCLEPVTGETARAILAGDLSGLTVADGWPHEDTADGLALALEHGHPPGWLITADAPPGSWTGQKSARSTPARC